MGREKVASVPVSACRRWSSARLPAPVAGARFRRYRVARARRHVGGAGRRGGSASSRQSAQRVDQRDAHAVQAAGDLLAVLVELTAGMQLGHDALGALDAFVLVDVDQDAPAVVGDRAEPSVFRVTFDAVQWPARASSMALSTTS